MSSDHPSANLERSVLGCVNLTAVVKVFKMTTQITPIFVFKQRLVAIGCLLLASFCNLYFDFYFDFILTFVSKFSYF